MISARRYYIDYFYFKETNHLSGTVLDIGGKKESKRGLFKPNNNLNCYYLNKDKTTNPDYELDANNFAIENVEFDYFILSEVLEHLEYPEECLKSAHKILKKGGLGFISMPFIYRKHEDPKDYQRWTDTKFKECLEKIDFKVISINNMGGVFSVINDFWLYSSLCSKRNLLGIINKILFRAFSPLLKIIDRKTSYLSEKITSGWFIIVEKK